MESKWRFNAWLLGLNWSPNRLYARILDAGIPNFYLIPAPDDDEHAYPVIWSESSGVSGEEIALAGGFAPLKPNGPGSPFPYGFNVEPDHV